MRTRPKRTLSNNDRREWSGNSDRRERWRKTEGSGGERPEGVVKRRPEGEIIIKLSEFNNTDTFAILMTSSSSFQITGKSILILGGTGSLGHAIVKKWASVGSGNTITIFSRDEDKQWKMKREYPLINFIIGDIRDYHAVASALKVASPNIVIIASALKHIDVCENHPSEAIKTNILGTQNVIEAVDSNLGRIEKVLFISTDKACAPTNTYGMCKSISERLIIEASIKKKGSLVSGSLVGSGSLVDYIVVRYGNVINSRGSLIPKFLEIALNPKEINFTVTDPGMTRFFMSLDDSLDLIENALISAQSGEVFVPHIKSFRIIDIAKWFSIKFKKEITYTGVRPGERLDESLINLSELPRSKKVSGPSGGTYYVIGQQSLAREREGASLTEEYTSKTVSDFKELETILNKLIPIPSSFEPAATVITTNESLSAPN